MAQGEAITSELTSTAIAEYMKADIAARAHHLHQSAEVMPTLAILSDNYVEGTPTKKYIDLKTKMGAALGIAVRTDVALSLDHLADRIDYYNQQPGIHGMIVQLPLVGVEHASHEARQKTTDTIVNTIAPEKDVDGLGAHSPFDPATPLGIVSLLKGNNVDYINQRVLMRGQGRLVGRPLLQIMSNHGARFLTHFDANASAAEMRAMLNKADIIISATGQPGGLTPESFDSSAPKVVVDAGTAEQKGIVVGDVSDELRTWGQENGWRFTPKVGGAGRLTVLNLLSHVVSAAEIAEPAPVPAPRRSWTHYFQTESSAATA